MVTVDVDAGRVERRLVAGMIIGPCGHALAGWGHARERVVRGEAGAHVRVRPRRARCGRCEVTHVLLPVVLLARRADTAAVIFAGLVGAAGGWGYLRVAAALGRAGGTVRGWIARVRARAEALRAMFTAVGCRLDPDPVLPSPAACPVADVLAAVEFARAAAASRWSRVGLVVSAAQLAVSVSGGALLSPAFVPESINTGSLCRPSR
jgi:hypothetical protein